LETLVPQFVDKEGLVAPEVSDQRAIRGREPGLVRSSFRPSHSLIPGRSREIQLRLPRRLHAASVVSPSRALLWPLWGLDIAKKRASSRFENPATKTQSVSLSPAELTIRLDR